MCGALCSRFLIQWEISFALTYSTMLLYQSITPHLCFSLQQSLMMYALALQWTLWATWRIWGIAIRFQVRVITSVPLILIHDLLNVNLIMMDIALGCNVVILGLNPWTRMKEIFEVNFFKIQVYLVLQPIVDKCNENRTPILRRRNCIVRFSIYQMICP